MTAWRVIFSRLLGALSPRGTERRLNEEIASHIEALAADFERRGLTPAEARLAARREFGGVAQIQEIHRERRGLPFIQSLLWDLRYSFRQMRASPGFTAAAVLTLALGIGANTAIFRVFDALLLRPLPVKEPERLALVQGMQGGRPMAFSYPLLREMASRQQAVEGIFASAELPVQDSALQARLATSSYFRLLGVAPERGRIFIEAEDRPGSASVAVISHGYAQREFGGASNALGRSVRVNGLPLTVIGVAPRGFFGEEAGISPDIWIPMSLGPRLGRAWLDNRAIAWIQPMARLRRGVSAARASAELSALYRQLIDLTMHVPGDYAIHLTPGALGLAGLMRRQFRAPLIALLSIAGLVLLIACCNLANLLLARAAARTHEMGVRLAIGSGRARLARQLLTESFVLASFGGALGSAIALWGARALVALASAGQGWQLELDPDWRIFLFTAASAMAAAAFFGLVPALSAARVDIHAALQTSRRTAAAGRPARRAARVFVVAQVTVSLLLVTGAALLIQSFRNLRGEDLGYTPERLLIAPFPFDPYRGPVPNQAICDRLKALPGVRSVALLATGPFARLHTSLTLTVPGQPPLGAMAVTATPDYFDVMGTPILAGRAWNARDAASSPPAAVLSETAARRLFPGENAVGRLIGIGNDQALVVGVAHDMRYSSLRDSFGPLVFRLLGNSPPITAVALRTTGDSALPASTVRQAIHDVAPRLNLTTMSSACEILDRMMSQEHTLALLSGAFGLLALALASVGLYGVIAYAVEQRTQEIGIRLALGARRTQVAGLLLREAGEVIVPGLALGFAGTLIASRWMRSLLFGLSPHDPAMLICAAGILAAVAFAAALLPARRASRLHPMEALRQE